MSGELVLTTGDDGLLALSVDIETYNGHIDCVGLATSKLDAICIPFMTNANPEGYWSPEEEFILVSLLRELLSHPNVAIIGQNFAYDAQYFARWWFFLPVPAMDTMLAQNVCFPGVKKSLDFLASMYCDFYRYWKDERKERNPKIGEEQGWIYNCKDCVNTYEVAFTLKGVAEHFGVVDPLIFQISLFRPVLGMMLRGIAVDTKLRAQTRSRILAAIAERLEWLESVLGHKFNPNSIKQMRALFYTDLALRPVYVKGAKGASTNVEALKLLALRDPIIEPLCKTIIEIRSLRVFLNTFIEAQLSLDRRMRCYFNIAGTETYRFSSSKDAFGDGGNLQNIPGDEAPITPNIRRIYIPDPGYIICDCDLEQADARVVAWDSNAKGLKAIFNDPSLSLHMENAKVVYGPSVTSKLDPRYKKAKAGVHATDYGCKPPKLAKVLGCTVHEADEFQRKWFGAHPEIKAWQNRLDHELEAARLERRVPRIHNAFGYHRPYFDRTDSILPEVLAWIPQSTVACVINRCLYNIHRDLPQVQLLLQVHDSLVFQVREEDFLSLLPKLKEAMAVTVPYSDPLVIPSGLKASPVSWGDCEKLGWEHNGPFPWEERALLEAPR